MCLTRRIKKKIFIKSRTITKKNGIILAWKAVKLRKDGKIYPSTQSKGKHFQVGRWLNEEPFRPDPWVKTLDDEINIRYRVGFHLTLTLHDAIMYSNAFIGDTSSSKTRFIKVYVPETSVCAYGFQEDSRRNIMYMIVAKDIFIPRQFPLTAKRNKCKKRI